MASPAFYEIVNVVAACASAIASIAAAVAAFKAHTSAQEAAAAAANSDKLSSLREVSLTASAVVLEAMAAASIASELNAEYQTAMVFSGSAEHSGIQSLKEASAALAAKAASFIPNAEVFTGGAASLRHASEAEIERVRLRLAEDIACIRMLRDDLARKCQVVRDMNQASRSASTGT